MKEVAQRFGLIPGSPNGQIRYGTICEFNPKTMTSLNQDDQFKQGEKVEIYYSEIGIEKNGKYKIILPAEVEKLK